MGSIVLVDWVNAYVVPLHNGIGGKCDYSSFRGISPSVVGEVHGR